MQSCFLSNEVIDAYLFDLAQRLEELPNETRPKVWCPLGPSGLTIAQRLLKYTRPINIEPIVWVRGAATAQFGNGSQQAAAVRGEAILAMDSAIHTGSTFDAALRLIHVNQARSITSYSVVVRAGARIIPNYFSLLIGDTDRTWLPVERLPNQRLTPSGVLRRLDEQDIDKRMIESGRGFIDRGSWSDHWYELATNPDRQVYVMEDQGELCAFVSFCFCGQQIRIDELAVDESAQRRQFGAYLMRWAENLARHRGCLESTLWSIEDRVSYYEKLGYANSGERLALGADGVFCKLKKRILYNLHSSAV